jgi:DNA-binding NarL/FixJ family response regulator
VVNGTDVRTRRRCGIVPAGAGPGDGLTSHVSAAGFDPVVIDDPGAADIRPDVVVVVDAAVPPVVPTTWLAAPVIAVRRAPCPPDRVVSLLVAGADAVVHGDNVPCDLTRALATVATGGTVVEPAVARVLVRMARLGPDRSPIRLTRREREVVQLFASGHSTAGVASALGVAEKTVRNVQTRVYAKLQVRSRPHAVLAAADMGLLDG